MIQFPPEESLKVWNNFWEATTEEFFKVEDIQDYAEAENVQQRSLRLWLAGDKAGALDDMRQHGQEYAQQMHPKSFKKIRIHIIEEPLSEYLKWEIEHYKLVNIPIGGEHVYLVNRKDVQNYDLGDFMMFDNKKVTKSHYSSTGVFKGMDIYEHESIQKFRDAKKLLMQYADEIAI